VLLAIWCKMTEGGQDEPLIINVSKNPLYDGTTYVVLFAPLPHRLDGVWGIGLTKDLRRYEILPH
jgi:hypothetical protein